MDRDKHSWMRWMLALAACTNIAAGLVMIIVPHAAGELAGLRSLRYPELIQAVGVLVTAFGLGYALAAVQPLTHWPVVFSGLLAKVVAPLGFAHAAMNGRVPASAGWAVLLGDVVWWVPFGLILRQAWSSRLQARREAVPEVLQLALRASTDTGLTLSQMSHKSPVLVVFLRHAGCTFCREALADLARQRRQIEQTGTAVVLVHMGEPDFGRDFFRNYGLDDIPQISDPRCRLYKGFGLARGSLRALFGPAVWRRGFAAGILARHGVGPLAGDGFQMPGLFLLYHGEVIASYRHQSVADRPNYVRFVRQESLSRILS
jgi:peroxiredoxin